MQVETSDRQERRRAAQLRYKSKPESRSRANELARARDNTPEGWLLRCIRNVRCRSKRMGLACDISASDVELPTFCPITLRPITLGDYNDGPSLDRVNPELGYVKGNVRVISFAANRAKQNITDPAVFERLAAYVREQASGG